MTGDRQAQEQARTRLAALTTDLRAGGTGRAETPDGDPGWVPVPPESCAEPAAQSGVETDLRRRALTSAMTAYSAAHGHPLDHPSPDAGQEEHRWVTRGRVVAAAVVVLGLLCLFVVLRSFGQVPSVAVERPASGVTEGSSAVEQPAGADLGEPGESPLDGSGAGSSESTAQGAAGASEEVVVVHVAGAVASPGVQTLPVGARVADALEAAGGPAPDADLTAINLARVLADGEQVLVLRPGEVAPAPSASGSSDPSGVPGAGPGGAPLDLNQADVAALDALPGIGPVLAQRIVDWRTTNGRFTSVEELREVSGIGAAVMERLRDLVRV